MLRLFTTSLLLLIAASPSLAGPLRAGVGRADVTPPVGTPLGGYAARKGGPSTGVHDPIHVKAVVLDDGDTRLALVTSDLVGTNPEMVRKVSEATGIPAERLLVSASHTHSGPGAYAKGAFAFIALGAFRESVFEQLTAGTIRAVREAQASLQPAALAIGETQFPEFMRNRRKLKIKDPGLWLMRVDTAEGRPLAALLNLTAHSTVLEEENMEFSGDWPAFTQAFLEREIPGLTALYTNGAEGDISPNIPDNSSTFEGARAHGELGGRKALELYRTLKPAREVKLGSRAAALSLPQTFSGALLGAGKETRLQCLSINDALLIAVPGEPITYLGLALKEHARRQGVKLPVIIGLANDHLGYFLTEGEMKKGGYEAQVSFFGPRFGEELTLALARLIGGDVSPVQDALRKWNEESR